MLAASYWLAEFYAQSDRMTSADQVLDWLSEKLTQYYRIVHNKTLTHTLRVAELFHGWSRVDDAMALLYRVLDSCEEGDSKRSTNGVQSKLPLIVSGQPGASNVQTDVKLPPTDHAIGSFAPIDEPAVVDYQLGLCNTLAKDNDEEAELMLLRLMEQCEAHPEKLARHILRTRCTPVDLYQPRNNVEQLNVALEQAKKAFWSAIHLQKTGNRVVLGGLC